jgi:hypothetical protein
MKKYFQTRLAFLGGGDNLTNERSRSAPDSSFFNGIKGWFRVCFTISISKIMFKNSLKIGLLASSLIVFGLVVPGTSGNLVQAQDLASVASSDAYSKQSVFCIKAKVKFGLGLKSGSLEPSLGVEVSGGRKDKCMPGFTEGCEESSCE